MELTHTFTVPASVQETWDALNDIESVAGCFPGAQVTSVEGDTFQGSVKVKLGPIAMVYNGTGTFVEKDEAAHTMKIEAKGKDKRGNGTAGADVIATMTDAGGETSVEVKTDLAVTGKPAQFGRGVMQDVSDKLLGQFVECLKTKVGDGGAAGSSAVEPAEAAGGAAGGATASAAGAEPAGPDTAPAGATGSTGTPSAATSEPGTAASEPAPAGAGPTAGSASGTTSGPASGATSDAASGSASASAAAKPAQQDDALDLGKTVLPVLAKTYWKPALAVVVVIVIIIVLIALL